MSSIDYSSCVVWISQKTSLALRASQEQDSLAWLQNPQPLAIGHDFLCTLSVCKNPVIKAFAWSFAVQDTVEAPVSEHPWDAKRVSITGARHSQKCKTTKFVCQLRKTGFCEGGCNNITCIAVRLRECPFESFQCVRGYLSRQSQKFQVAGYT